MRREQKQKVVSIKLNTRNQKLSENLDLDIKSMLVDFLLIFDEYFEISLFNFFIYHFKQRQMEGGKFTILYALGFAEEIIQKAVDCFRE